jgi:hypothetical protein
MPVQPPPNLDELLRVLKAATERNTVQWQTTAEEDTFRAQLGSGMVRISKTPNGSRCVLSLLDENGTLLDEYQPSGEGELIALGDLYKTARRRALNLDWKLRSLYDQLKALAGES